MVPILILALQLAPYIQRGNEVEASYRQYTAALGDYYATLRETLVREAPDLVDLLKEAPQKPVEYGYQVLPRIVGDAPATATQQTGNGSTGKPMSYSWPQTRQYIAAEAAKISLAREKLGSVPALRELAEGYRLLIFNQKRIEENLQYNRFWQNAIAEDRPRFDRQTADYQAALEGKPQAGIQSGFVRSSLPKLEQSGEGEWIVHLPIYTDIADSGFLDQVESAVERVWRIAGDGLRARVDVRIVRLRPEDLYGNGSVPAPGSHIDIESHVKRSPADGAVLTTGATSTYAVRPRYVAFGPAEIAPNVIAHEIGHLLGFGDGYFRGYRDLGDDGFEIFEFVPNSEEIMSAPGAGRVLEDHFRILIQR